MEMIPDETVLSCPEYPSAAFDKLIEATLFQRPTRPLQGRILRVPTIRRRRSVQSSQESGVPQDLQVSLNVSPRSTTSTDPWSTSGFVEDESVMDRSGDELGDSDALVEPKLESPDNDVQMDDLLEAASMSTSTPTPGDSELEPRARRPRGRPRKHPVPSSEVVTKVQKGRSKTGCITCRRRKKKCDETKPSCLNCEKNAVICEGYLDKRFWRSGKERGEEAQRRRFSVPNIQNITLAPIIHGVVTPSDRIFLQHYCFRLSVVLTVEGPRRNAFKDMLLPMAVQHLGLMHSILALSSSNLDYDEPYGRALLAEHPELNVQMMKERAQYHHEEAMKEFYASVDRENDGIVSESTLCVRYGQMLCLVVQSLAKGTATGEHRIHLQAYQELIKGGPPDPGPFMQFIEEFFQFHIGLDDIISLPPGSLRLGAIGDDWNLPAVIQPEAVRLLGVQDGLFFLMSKITSVRNSIRANMEQGIDPVVDYTSLYRAAEIDAGIRAWQPSWPEGDSRELAGTLYKQMMWVYLWRTIYPPKTTTWQPEYKITVVVNQGIEILGKFPPKSQVQTLLLSPTFLIGCAAFDPAQRGPIRKSIAIIKAYTHLKNTDLALEVLEQVWKYMDDKDERSWDWQGVAHDMGRDFLAT